MLDHIINTLGVGLTERIPLAEDKTTFTIMAGNRAVVEPENFELLLNSVDEALMHLFNETAAKSIYTYMKGTCHLERKDIANKPDLFSASLEKLLGSGAFVIENLILKNLCSKLELEFAEREDYKFPDYIRKLKKAQRFESKHALDHPTEG